MVKIIYIILNCILNVVLLSFGHYFVLIAFFLSVLNLILIPILFRKESNLIMAALTIVLMVLFSTIQILDGHYNCDNGGFAFMVLFTIIITIVPMSISTLVHIFIYIKRHIKRGRRK